MPVLITGAAGMVGRALAKRLIVDGAQVRAYIRSDDAELRAIGVHVALGAIDDVQRIEAACTGVHTLVHLVGGMWPGPRANFDALNRESTECAVIAAAAADVRRVVFVSYPGADDASENAFLAAKGAAEAHVTGSGLEYAIFRPVPTLEWYARTFARLQLGTMVSVPGDGKQRVNPPRLTMLVDALVAADVREGEVRGTWEIGGAEIVTLDEIAAAAVEDARPSHMKLFSPMPKVMRDVLSRDTIVDPAPAIARFGLR